MRQRHNLMIQRPPIIITSEAVNPCWTGHETIPTLVNT